MSPPSRSRRWSRAGRAATTLCIATAGLLLPGPARAGAQVIAGRVVEETSGAAVSGAEVTVSAGSRIAGRATADSLGRYAIALPFAGRFRVQAARTGYEPAGARGVRVGPGDTARVELRLRPRAVRLRAVTATKRRPRIPVHGKYCEGFGTDSTLRAGPRVEVRPHGILARGLVYAPSGCYQLAGAAERDLSVITLVIQARPNGDLCTGGPMPFNYAVTIGGVRPGTYTFRIGYAFRDGSVPTTTAVDTTLTVP